MKSLALAAVWLVVLAGSASAQFKLDSSRNRFPSQDAEEERRKEAADIDKKYKAAVKNTGKESASKADPWAGARASEQGAKR